MTRTVHVDTGYLTDLHHRWQTLLDDAEQALRQQSGSNRPAPDHEWDLASGEDRVGSAINQLITGVESLRALVTDIRTALDHYWGTDDEAAAGTSRHVAE